MISISSFALAAAIHAIDQQLANLNSQLMKAFPEGTNVGELEGLILSHMKVACSLRESYEMAIGLGYLMTPYAALTQATRFS